MEIVIDPTFRSDIIENLGQLEDDSILFYTMGRFRAALGEDSIRYSMEREMEDGSRKTDCWEVEFTGSLPANVEAGDRTSTTYNFFYGSDPEKWVTDVNGHSSVLYENIYPGIDLLFHTDTGDMKYDLVLHPGSDPANIMLTVKGHDSIRVIDNELLIELSDGTMVREKDLRVHYRESGIPIGSSFRLVDDDTFTFNLEEYDRTETIVIDPVVYSTYVGGLGSDQAYGMYVDGSGDSYVTGQTTARSFPVTPGAYSTEWQGSLDAYVLRMNDNGTDIDFCTLIGGSTDESGFAVTLDGSDNIYLAGRVSSSDFPTTSGAYSRTYSGLYDLFVCKFDPTASNLLFSTYVGGESSEWPQNIALDGSNNIFVGGIVNGQGFPTTSAAMGSDYGGGDIDGFLFKMNPQGSGLTYSTYVGGDHDDRVTGLVLDDQGYAYISGYTRSSDFPLTTGAYDTTLEGSSDGYVMKVANDGSAPVYSTLFGGDAGDGIYDLAMTDDGDLMFTG
ncbi:MAG: SBBP repeat-containing protein, partial [Thermoplasmatota archaeon]